MVCIERPGVARMLRGRKRFGRFHVVTNYDYLRILFWTSLVRIKSSANNCFLSAYGVLASGHWRLASAQTRHLADIPNHCHLMNANMYQAYCLVPGSGDAKWNNTEHPALAGLRILAEESHANSLWSIGANVILTEEMRFCRITVKAAISPGELKTSLHRRPKGALQNGQDCNRPQKENLPTPPPGWRTGWTRAQRQEESQGMSGLKKSRSHLPRKSKRSFGGVPGAWLLKGHQFTF